MICQLYYNQIQAKHNFKNPLNKAKTFIKTLLQSHNFHCDNNLTKLIKMDELDLKRITAIPHHETIGILNQYLINYTNHINKMTDYSQKEMLEIDFQIDQLQKKVIILQQKLGLEAHTQAEPAKQQPQKNLNPPPN